MFKLFSLLWAILKDDKGINWMWPFDEGDEEVYDPYAPLRGDYQAYLQKKLGQRTPYTYNPAFELTQPGIEKQTESVISSKLGALPTTGEYKGKVEAAKTQQIAREKERAAEQRKEEMNTYNRLGLVSSTPWLEREGELGEESLMRQKDIETGMDIYGLGYGLESDKLVNDIINNYLTQGQMLGARQRGYQQYPIAMSEEDLQRMIEEELGYAGAATSLLGGTLPQREYTPSFAENLFGVGADMLPYLIMLGM